MAVYLSLFAGAGQQFFTNAGVPLAGGKIYTYGAGGSTPQATYTTSAGNIAHSNPIVLDAAGRVPGGGEIWLTDTLVYKFVLETSAGVTVQTLDNVSASIGSAALVASSGSSLIGFIQAGSGAVARTAQAKMRDIVSVLDFGADPTGVTDSSTAITNALATGKSIFFPIGTYVSGAQTISTAGQTIFGEGDKSVIVASAKNINLFTVTAAYVQIKDLRLNGIETDATNSKFAIFTTSATPAQYLSVDNVLFSGTGLSTGWNNAIKFDDNCNYGVMSNCRVERLWGNTSGRGYGVLAGNAIGCRVTNNNMIATSGRGRHGIYFSAGCSDSVAEGNYLSAFDFEGISQFSTGAQPTCARNIYSNNTLFGCAASTNPFSGAIGIYGHSFGAVVSNNTITGSGQKGIAIDGSSVTDCANTLVVGNTVAFSGTVGIDLTSTVRCSVIGNIVGESSTASAGTSPNIFIRTDGTTACTQTLIESNTVYGSNTRSAIFVAPTPAPSILNLEANIFRPGLSGTLELNGVTGIQIDGRLQFRFASVGYGPIANGASFTGPLALPGASQGDICTVSHDQNTDGCVLYVYSDGTNTGVLTIGNLSGGSKTIPSGNLRVDVWKRNAPL